MQFKCQVGKGDSSRRPPFSVFVLVVCRSIFSNLIKEEKRVGNIKGIVTCRDGRHVSHLLFADDTLILCQATREAGLCIKSVLRILEEASGLKMNMGKSAIIFNIKHTQHVREDVAAVLGVSVIDKHDKHLGLPAMVGQ
ncbi:UNVERIFIED_CONTAM: hypothetical protein Sradi_3205300 [Sesamum radiatum]|uniref:Reverse transcriptase domain-containing protein n=1 Tax=Sesamum radiatum TaxID=300843 RepID=A0AAW2RGQ7_SESRA